MTFVTSQLVLEIFLAGPQSKESLNKKGPKRRKKNFLAQKTFYFLCGQKT